MEYDEKECRKIIQAIIKSVEKMKKELSQTSLHLAEVLLALRRIENKRIENERTENKRIENDKN